MITDKEYPATHSMDTAWFAIDTDGNVGILDFNDNGPVPDGIPQTSPDYVLIDTMSDKYDGIRVLPWTDDQVEEVLKRMTEYNADKELDFTTIVQIDVTQTDKFRKMFTSRHPKDDDSCALVCFSEQKGLYFADFFDIKMTKAQQGIILKYMDFYPDCNDSYDREKEDVVFEHDFEHMPVYLFQQPYWTGFLMRRTYVPRYPLTESQLSDHVREKALRLPFRFDDRDEMQIAEYFPFSASDMEMLNSGEYCLLPVGHGKKSYIRNNSLPFVRCGKTCNRCGSDTSDESMHCLYAYQYCERPTLAVIYGTHSSMEHEWMEHWPVLRHAVALPITYEYLVHSFSNMGEYIRKKKCGDVFEYCKGHLEEALQTVKPYALILFKETKNKLAQYYHIEGDRITIDGVEYPFFMYNRMAEVYDDVKSYAEMPYRGKAINRVKDMEERQSEE